MIPNRYFEDLRRLSRAYHGRTGRPLVTLSFAQSLDGSLARTRGEPLALSGPQSLVFTHRLRAAHDAILVGIGTVLADDPRLTARGSDGGSPRPVILDSKLRIPGKARLWAHPCGPWIFVAAGVPAEDRDAVARRGGRCFEVSRSHVRLLDLPAVLAELGRNDIRSLMIEGGATVITRFLAEGLVDRVAITIAPVFVGGLRALEDGPVQIPGLVDVKAYQLGADVVLTGVFDRV